MYVVQWILIIVSVCLYIFIIADIFPIFYTWYSRIYIGRFNDRGKWENIVIKKASKWLIKTPIIKKNDNNRWILLDKLKGNYSSKTIQHWQEGALLLGLTEYLKSVPNNNEVKKNINIFLQKTFTPDGKWRINPEHIDGALLAYATMKLDYSKQFVLAYDFMYDLIIENLDEDFTIRYRKGTSNDYRYIDTIGFVCPFLIKYGLETKKNESIDIGVKQILDYYRYGFDKDSGIPFHAYNIRNYHKLGLCGWGRGVGWFALGIIDSWNELPSNSKYKAQLERIIIDFCKTILQLQLENGGFGWTINRFEVRTDSSTTAILSYFLICASTISEIHDPCMKGYNKTLTYLSSVTRRNGCIDFSQGDTKDIGVYSMLFDILPFTQGLVVRAFSKVNGELLC